MKKAGGITALIGGVFGILFGLFTLSIGGIASALDSPLGEKALWAGFLGLAAAGVQVVLGAMAVSAAGKKIGPRLIGASIFGLVGGNILSCLSSLLALVGGILVLVEEAKSEAVRKLAAANNSVPSATNGGPWK